MNQNPNKFSSQEKEVVTVRDDDETPVSAVQAAASRHRSSAGWHTCDYLPAPVMN